MGESVAKALKGRRVIVTRGVEQSEQLVKELETRGAVPLVIPMVAFGPPDNAGPLDDALLHGTSYDWLLLTSQNAVRMLAERTEFLHLDLQQAFSGVKIAAVGPATAEAIKSSGLPPTYVASRHQGTALAEELGKQVRGKRVLLPRSDRANPDLVETLWRLGAEVTEVCAYKTLRPSEKDLDGAANALKQRADAVLFFSPSAAHHLQEALGQEEFLSLSRRSVFTAVGPVTEQALRKLNVERVLLARDTSARAVVEILAEHFAQGSGSTPHGTTASAGAKRP